MVIVQCKLYPAPLLFCFLTACQIYSLKLYRTAFLILQGASHSYTHRFQLYFDKKEVIFLFTRLKLLWCFVLDFKEKQLLQVCDGLFHFWWSLHPLPPAHSPSNCPDLPISHASLRRNKQAASTKSPNSFSCDCIFSLWVCCMYMISWKQVLIRWKKLYFWRFLLVK